MGNDSAAAYAGACVQELQVKHDAALAEAHAVHSRELAALQRELEAQQSAERQQLDDSSRVHDELLEVRGELAKTRSEHEAMYHQQLLPAQVRRAAVRATAAL
jgi:hypothetical protein